MMIEPAERIMNSSNASILSRVRRVSGRKAAKASVFHTQSHFSAASSLKSAVPVVNQQ
jgi:hypothetical protein